MVLVREGLADLRAFIVNNSLKGGILNPLDRITYWQHEERVEKRFSPLMGRHGLEDQIYLQRIIQGNDCNNSPVLHLRVEEVLRAILPLQQDVVKRWRQRYSLYRDVEPISKAASSLLGILAQGAPYQGFEDLRAELDFLCEQSRRDTQTLDCLTMDVGRVFEVWARNSQRDIKMPRKNVYDPLSIQERLFLDNMAADQG